MPTNEVEEAGKEEPEVKSEDQTADVSQPDPKVRQVNQRPQYFLLLFPEHIRFLTNHEDSFWKYPSLKAILESEICFQHLCLVCRISSSVFQFQGNSAVEMLDQETSFSTNLM